MKPEREAEDIICDAFETSGKKRFALARKALSVSRDCADAYIILAEEAMPDKENALGLLEEGVRAGERTLGKRIFREEAGNFWLIFETRPYMRARYALGQHLHTMGELSRAREIFTDLLRLNPNDNQGARYDLATCLLEQGDPGALENLLTEYDKDGSAVWLYSRALLKFRQEGRGPAADACLKKAIDENPFVPLYFLGKKKLPSDPLEYISRGDWTEAVEYVLENRRVWEETPDALAWMESTISFCRPGKGNRR